MQRERRWRRSRGRRAGRRVHVLVHVVVDVVHDELDGAGHQRADLHVDDHNHPDDHDGGP